MVFLGFYCVSLSLRCSLDFTAVPLWWFNSRGIDFYTYCYYYYYSVLFSLWKQMKYVLCGSGRSCQSMPSIFQVEKSLLNWIMGSVGSTGFGASPALETKIRDWEGEDVHFFLSIKTLKISWSWFISIIGITVHLDNCVYPHQWLEKVAQCFSVLLSSDCETHKNICVT